jgi:hypothetical protein
MFHEQADIPELRVHRGEPTLASVWHSVTEGAISDEFLDWPPDVFALTDAILSRSEAYRFVFSPPEDSEWPPKRVPDWPRAVEEAGRHWGLRVENAKAALPELLADEWRALRERFETSLEDLAAGREWRVCEALLTLHAIADEACAGLGSALDGSPRKGCLYRAYGRELLARTGSLARVPSQFLRVLPKLRTPPAGTLWRSFSRYACVPDCHIKARWNKVPVRRVGTDAQARHANLLLLPWPLRVRASDFRAFQGSVHRPDKEPFGLFEFAPREKLDLDLVSRLIVAARDEVDSVDCLMLPEGAVEEAELHELEVLLGCHGVAVLMTGVRGRSAQRAQLPSNWVHMGISPTFEKNAPPSSAAGEQWFHIRQNKHQQWSLDERQVYQYHLGSSLHPHVRWWEAMEVHRREIQFVELGDGITIVCLVCEDLAQSGDVAQLLRSVGPTVIYAPLLDGPQLGNRWAARYASVLADDPGSAVSTLTSYGMVERCRPNGMEASSVVGFWRDPTRGMRLVSLEPGAEAVLLSVSGSRSPRRTADGRCAENNTTDYFDVAIHQVRAGTIGAPSANVRPSPPAPRVLDNEELTILTGWAEALAEALVYDPGCVEAVLAEEEDTMHWRAKLGLPEPSAQLRRAIHFIYQTFRMVASLDCNRVDALRASLLGDRQSEDALDRLARRVMRSTLEQVITR